MIAQVQQRTNFTRANTKYSLSLHYNDDESYLHGKTEICKFKAYDKIP